MDALALWLVGIGSAALAAGWVLWSRHQRAWRDLRAASDPTAVMALLRRQGGMLVVQIREGLEAAEDLVRLVREGPGRRVTELAGRLSERFSLLRTDLAGRAGPFLERAQSVGAGFAGPMGHLTDRIRTEWDGIVLRLETVLARLAEAREELVRAGGGNPRLMAALDSLQQEFETLRRLIPAGLAKTS